MAIHVTITTFQRLAHLRRGHVTACPQWDDMDLFYKFIKDDVKGEFFHTNRPSAAHSYFHFGIPLWRFAVTQCSIQNTKWGSSWHFQSIRVCRMVVACKVSLKQCLNFWTCHLVFLPCYCMCTLAVFLLQVEEGTREVGLCVNFPN